MKKNTILQLLAIIFGCIGIIFLIISIATDINDAWFLPIALGCVTIGLFTSIYSSKKSK